MLRFYVFFAERIELTNALIGTFVSICLFENVISETTQRILMKFGMEVLTKSCKANLVLVYINAGGFE
jgi:hypothetical protein